MSISLVLAALLALIAAPSALAGSFSYGQPGNFTAAPPGANPDHDAYGGTPWSYVESGTGRSHDPTAYKRLPSFQTGLAGGLAGWTDPSDANPPLAAVNPGSAPITGSGGDAGDTFATGQLVLRPASDRVVAVGWTSPFSQTTTVAVNGTVTAADGGGLCFGYYSWSLEQNGVALQGPNGTANGTVTSTATVPAGGSIYLVVDYPNLFYSAPCDTAEATLLVGVQRSAGPAVTLTSPAAGALFTGGQPTFAGAASTAYGASKQVTVRVYSGSAASGTPLETLHTTATGSTWSVAPSPALADGTYTAVAEQDDLASPPDAGTSAPATFVISTPVQSSTLVLSSPARGAVTTATPTLTGTAGAGAAGRAITVVIYPGFGTNSTAVRYLSTTAAADGSFSVAVTPGLGDGAYTGVAAQNMAGSITFSAPVPMLIKVHPPALTMIAPVLGGEAGPRPVFFGLAGNELGDSATVSLSLFAGQSTAGRSLGTVAVQRTGGGWIYSWPGTLKLGLYTAMARQTDIAGHTTSTSARTFLVVPAPSVIGGSVTVSQNGTASVPIYCPARYGSTCTGTVTIVTVKRLRAGRGRPQRLTLMRVRVAIPGAATLIVRGHLNNHVHRALLHAGTQSVQVTASLSLAGGAASTYTAKRRAALAR